jgi:hypothetical protein
MRRASLILLAACTIAQPAHAAAPVAVPAPATATGFLVIRRSTEAWTLIDPSAIERTAGSPVLRTYSVTVRRNLLNGGPPQPGYVRTLSEYDCLARRTRWRSFTIYSRFGAVVLKQDNPDPAFALPVPGSEEDITLRVVCDGGGGGSVVAASSLGQLVIGLMRAWDEPAPLPPGVKPAPSSVVAKAAETKPEPAKRSRTPR